MAFTIGSLIIKVKTEGIQKTKAGLDGLNKGIKKIWYSK